jgi:Na+/proline symporter
MAMTTLQWPDYVILVLFMVISLGIGVYHSLTGGRQRTVQEFIMGNRKLGVLPTAMSLFVSFKSAIMVLGVTAEMYLFGAQYSIWAPASIVLGTILVERLVVPWIYPLKLVSINDVSIRSNNMLKHGDSAQSLQQSDKSAAA